MLTTKKMLKDIKTLKKENLFVCNICGSTEVSEKIWVNINSCLSLQGELYYKFIDSDSDVLYWCGECGDATRPVEKSEYKGDENA